MENKNSGFTSFIKRTLRGKRETEPDPNRTQNLSDSVTPINNPGKTNTRNFANSVFIRVHK